MTPEQINALIEQLLKTGEILATKGYELAYRQTIIYGWENIIVAILLLIPTVILWKYNKESDWITGIIACIIHIGQLMVFFLGMEKLLNPEWFAVKLILFTLLRK